MNPWLGVGYIPGGLNTSDGLAESTSSVNLGSLLTENTFQIAKEQMKTKLGKATCVETLHRVSGYNTGAENVE